MPLFVDQCLVHHYGTTERERVVRFGDQFTPPCQAPVVQYLPEDDHVSLRQWVEEEISGLKLDPIGYAAGHSIIFESLPSHWQIETNGRQVRMRAQHPSCQCTLPAADIDKAIILVPRKFSRYRLRGSSAHRCHHSEKSGDPIGGGILRCVEILCR